MAAALLVGVFAGRLVAFPGDDVTTAGGQLVARGELARALSVQLAATQAPDAPVRVVASYLAKSGDYCRSFVLTRSQSAGVACRQGGQWALGILVPAHAEPGVAGGLRMAGSALPPQVLRTIDEQSQTPLDARAEQSALQAGWRAPGR
jgi:hypothetical protein